MTEKEYWLYLAKVKGMESGRRRVLMEMFGTPEEIFKAKEETLRKIPLLEDFHIEQLLQFRNIDFNKELERFNGMDIGFVTVDDEEFPERLREIPDAPSFLFFRGELPKENVPSVAIVGSRKCSIYGREMCLKFSERLAQAGIQIISGMAAGVDGFAHRGAINAGGKTTAVLGCGVDVCYPSQNRDIFDILSGTKRSGVDENLGWMLCSLGSEKEKDNTDKEGKDKSKEETRKLYGGIVSEYYPGDKALQYHFPQRNRIISGLADILLVVEAGKKSGTFITVDHALEQGRDIFAIPGRIGDKVSDGCNSLIKNGASIATEPEDIIDELKKRYEVLLLAERKRKKASYVKLEGDERKVFEALESIPVQINDIAERTRMDCGKLSQVLIGLELKGVIEEVGKNLYIRK